MSEVRETDPAGEAPPVPAAPPPAAAGAPAALADEFGGRAGPEPTRYGDWEKNGRCIDF